MEGRTDGFMPFPVVSIGSETQTALTSTWTQVTDSISYGNKCYA